MRSHLVVSSYNKNDDDNDKNKNKIKNLFSFFFFTVQRKHIDLKWIE